MKKLILVTILIIATASNANAYLVLTDMLDFIPEEVQRADGTFNFDELYRIKTDGINRLHYSATHKWTDEELKEMYRVLGPGIVYQESLSYIIATYRDAIRLIGRVDIHMAYNEEHFLTTEYVRGVPYDPTIIWEEYRTILAPYQIDNLYQRIAAEGMPESPGIQIMTRWYNGKMVQVVDNALEDPRVSGITVEMKPIADNIKPLGIDKLIKKVVDMGKDIVLMVSSPIRHTGRPYEVDLEQYLRKLRKYVPEELKSDLVSIMAANYGCSNWKKQTTTWFGPKNSVEAAIIMLKDQPEYHNQGTNEPDSNGPIVTGCFINSLGVFFSKVSLRSGNI